MIVKSGLFPFSYSQIALLIVSLTVVGRPAFADSNEAPAVLQFARKYQQQQHDHPPRKSTDPKKKRQASRNTNEPNVVTNKPSVQQKNDRQQAVLQKFSTQNKHQISMQANTVKKIEQRLSRFQTADKNQPLLTSVNLDLLQKIASSWQHSLILHPSVEYFVEILRKANIKLEKASLTESDILEQHGSFIQEVDMKKKQLDKYKSNFPTATLDDQSVLKKLVNKLRSKNGRLEADLADTRSQISRYSDEVKQLQSTITGLESEKKHYLNNNKMLSLQLSSYSSTAVQLESMQKQHQELQDKIRIKQNQLSQLREEKIQLQQQLAKVPKAAELADSQQKVKVLQSQLDAALLLQQRQTSEVVKARADSVTLQNAKKSAGEEIVTLQLKIDIAQQQQARLLADLQQLEKKLQDELLNKEKNGAAIAEQLKNMQEKLTAVQQKYTAVTAEKDHIQKQLAKAPTASELARSQQKVKTLESQLAAVQKQQTSGIAHAQADSVEMLNAKKSTGDTIAELKRKLDEAQQQLSSAQKPSEGSSTVTAATLKNKAIREAYAIGISLGEEILQLNAENKNWSSAGSDKPSVLAGIVDAFKGQPKLQTEVIQKTLMNISEEMETDRKKYIDNLDNSTKQFMDEFKKNRDTKKSDSGFWYRIGYIGDTPIPAGATLDVVVKESLADGFIIEDMDAKGMVLTQTISDFPPLFKEALSKLKNHGSITIVAPPSLAYGSKGYPPKVPPNATMVYDIRIAEVYPEKTIRKP